MANPSPQQPSKTVVGNQDDGALPLPSPQEEEMTASMTTTTINTKSKRNLGRKGRIRRKKIAEIESMAAATNNTNSNTTTLPQDRNHVWPAAEKLRDLSEEDQDTLFKQLGYVPGNAIQVVARIRDIIPNSDDAQTLHNLSLDDPLVLRLYPLVLREESDSTKSRRKRKKQNHQNQANLTWPKADGQEEQDNETSSNNHNMLVEPFPTHLWCTHPHMRVLISKIELEQRGKQFEEQLAADPEALESIKRAHLAYGQDRCSIITEEDWKYIETRGWQTAFSATDRGVAGIRNFASIKCLHAHAAHYWSGCQDNVVGRWVSDELLQLMNNSNTSDEDAEQKPPPDDNTP